MNMSDVNDLHAFFMKEIEPFGFEKDASMRPLGLFHMLKTLEQGSYPHIGEFGGGYSSLGLRKWVHPGTKVTTVDHHPEWAEFLRTTLTKMELRADNIVDLGEFRNETHMMGAPIFDAVLIDHGPTMGTRQDDVPWIISLVKPGGLIIFDDWFPTDQRTFRSTKRLARIVTRMGYEYNVIEESRPKAHDKAICLVRKV